MTENPCVMGSERAYSGTVIRIFGHFCAADRPISRFKTHKSILDMFSRVKKRDLSISDEKNMG
jgi:hypothetical protein